MSLGGVTVMFKLASVASFGCSVGMLVWGDASGLWTWQLMMVIGFLLWGLADMTGK